MCSKHDSSHQVYAVDPMQNFDFMLVSIWTCYLVTPEYHSSKSKNILVSNLCILPPTSQMFSQI